MEAMIGFLIFLTAAVSAREGINYSVDLQKTEKWLEATCPPPGPSETRQQTARQIIALTETRLKSLKTEIGSLNRFLQAPERRIRRDLRTRIKRQESKVRELKERLLTLRNSKGSQLEIAKTREETYRARDELQTLKTQADKKNFSKTRRQQVQRAVSRLERLTGFSDRYEEIYSNARNCETRAAAAGKLAQPYISTPETGYPPQDPEATPQKTEAQPAGDENKDNSASQQPPPAAQNQNNRPSPNSNAPSP